MAQAISSAYRRAEDQIKPMMKASRPFTLMSSPAFPATFPVLEISFRLSCWRISMQQPRAAMQHSAAMLAPHPSREQHPWHCRKRSLFSAAHMICAQLLATARKNLWQRTTNASSTSFLGHHWLTKKLALVGCLKLSRLKWAFAEQCDDFSLDFLTLSLPKYTYLV
jgi:hypothetical protein